MCIKWYLRIDRARVVWLNIYHKSVWDTVRDRDVITPMPDSTPEWDLRCFFRAISIPTPLYAGSNSRLELIPLVGPIHINDAFPVLEPIPLYAKHKDMSKC